MLTIRRLLAYLKTYWWQSSIGLFTMFAVTGIQLLYPYIIGKGFIDQVLDARNNQLHSLNIVIVAAFGITILKAIFTFLENYSTAYVGQRVVTDFRDQIFQHLQKLSISYHESHRVGETIARLTNDIGNIQHSVSRTLIDLIYQVLLLTGTLFAIVILNWKLALLTIFAFPLVFLVVSLAGQRIRTISRHIQEKIADIASILQETLIGIRVVKAFSMEKKEILRFNKQNESSFTVSMHSAKIMAILNPLVELLFMAGLALVFWYGGKEVISGHLTKGALVSFFGYIGLAMAPLSSITNNLSSIQSALASADRIFELLDQKVEIKDAPDAVELLETKGEVIFQDVTFGYQSDQLVLSHIDLMARSGEIIALVGPSGAGKTSLANLIMRFYDPLSGRILIDGIDIAKVKMESLRKHIGLVPQESVLFGMSVKENIAYGTSEAKQVEIEAAARAANAHDFIMGLSEGYDTRVGERGASLSGGQRQRLAIARALLRNPQILILDEATSALDNESEKLIQEALERLMKGKTTFIIAHRLSTIQHADKIIVLDNGVIVEQGTHVELLKSGGLYRKLYDMGTEILR